MAGRRLEKVGTVFIPVRDLMQAGVVKLYEKPIWFDVNVAFPPKKRPPVCETSLSSTHQAEKDQRLPEIFYSEDAIRAKLYQVYGARPRALDLSKFNFVSVCQRFVD
ncbi:28S ribosomal protein S23, mitochondrial [Periophthalmus magnuspinnatus]|uniref:28S ribosomal protein S23, mitochondrial n=1 Tax=Periophthalmus magnuspinnatus TaxID=409849 RepID=UPI0024363395|nr:28S ribosomal protein S23, mitochondrial [Periophthalmus magnuspinnatus]